MLYIATTLLLRIIRSLLYFNIVAPIGRPDEVNVTAVSSGSVSLIWLPPPSLLRNGVIREYRINLTEVDTGRELVFYSSTASITITSLHPFYTYVCYVSAFTVDYGPYSERFLFSTLEDGQQIITCIIILITVQ